MTELISLLNELLTLEKLAVASGAVPKQVGDAISKVVDVLSKTELVTPNSVANVLTDVRSLVDAIDQLEADVSVKQYASQVITLIENIVKLAKPAPVAPVSVPSVPASN
jgi:hypothetical protein